MLEVTYKTTVLMTGRCECTKDETSDSPGEQTSSPCWMVLEIAREYPVWEGVTEFVPPGGAHSSMTSGAATAPARPRGWFPEHRDRNEQGKTKQVDIIECSPIWGSMYGKSQQIGSVENFSRCVFSHHPETLSRYGHFSPSCRVVDGWLSPP